MLDTVETFPMDFVVAAQSDGTMIYISSEEDDGMDCRSVKSVSDVLLSSDQESEDIAMMDICVERHLANTISIPNSSSKPNHARAATPRPLFLLHPTFDREVFELGTRNGLIQRDDRVRSNTRIYAGHNSHINANDFQPF